MNILNSFILLLLITYSVQTLADTEEMESKLNTEFNGSIEQHHVVMLAEQLFNENTKNEYELDIRCVKDNQELNNPGKWICVIYPMNIGDQELAPVAPPDTNDWILTIDFKSNKYQLKKLWQQP